ncbi:MAG: nickel pincer cofactor biosynthesis protein LarC [Syntrophaceae bacterium]
MRTLYYECFAGISGDMNLGAMLDLGVNPQELINELKKLDIGPYEIRIRIEQRKGITGTRVEVLVPEESRTEERRFRDIVSIIEQSSLADKVKDLSLKIFLKLAEAEAKVHGHTVDEVHFHEVGAVDSIVDIAGAAVCLDFLGVENVIASPVQLGGGFAKCRHGLLPVPAPATAEILRGIPVKTGAVPFETTTPTGAAILAATATEFTDRLEFTPEKIGYGVGGRDTDIPNVLRVFLFETAGAAIPDGVEMREALLIECNIDDMVPELYDTVMDELFEKGARDVFLTPIIMKKSRPAVKISIICEDADRQGIEEALWLRTTTFGLRATRISKAMLKRDFTTVKTKYGEVRMKTAWYRGRKIKSKPEYEDCKRLAREKGVSIRDILESLEGDG